MKPIKDKLDELIEGQGAIEEQTEYFHKAINQLKVYNKQMESRIDTLVRENKELKDRIIQQESHSRRNNLRFYGLPESKFDNIEDKVLGYLHNQGLNFHPRSIEQAHRLGGYSQGKTRPVIVHFLHFKDREVVWRKLGHGLIPPSYNKPHVREDYPVEIEESRSTLLPVAVAASKITDPRTQKPPRVQLITDKLYINSQRYTKSSLHTLPENLLPQKIFTPTNHDKTAFFTHNSPLSNHYPSPFKINGENFLCMEQHLMVTKARLFGDQQVVAEVMKETSPVKQKQAGKKIKDFDKHLWEGAAEEKLMPGLLGKFEQNHDCKALLLSTGNNTIIEANVHDTFFGAGVSLRSPNLWTTSSHPGKNIVGKMLHRVRQKLQQSEGSNQ